ncbi:TPA: hypothetical protein HA265_01685 [Candidatus Woesearchaeota archaeon]|nr:hypothetical protein [Candidatus Woesearchaeota archaeon]
MALDDLLWVFRERKRWVSCLLLAGATALGVATYIRDGSGQQRERYAYVAQQVQGCETEGERFRVYALQEPVYRERLVSEKRVTAVKHRSRRHYRRRARLPMTVMKHDPDVIMYNPPHIGHIRLPEESMSVAVQAIYREGR